MCSLQSGGVVAVLGGIVAQGQFASAALGVRGQDVSGGGALPGTVREGGGRGRVQTGVPGEGVEAAIAEVRQ